MDPLFTAVAVALVGKSAGALFDLVSSKIKASRMLARVTSGDSQPNSIRELAGEIEKFATSDSTFDQQIRALFASQAVDQGNESAANSVQSSHVQKLVQARDINGDVTL